MALEIRFKNLFCLSIQLLSNLVYRYILKYLLLQHTHFIQNSSVIIVEYKILFQISEGWILGPELCDIWTSCDVLCCTASILHLVAIATDR